ncbi:MAG: hypothetical protein K5872_05135 [Rhizobiaceae bacterium]|nr:hypothetical protein [Rhizobiaceae bacterium]MCV0405594.1 hypothetical protein [Rhizobiaceae bacterium]
MIPYDTRKYALLIAGMHRSGTSALTRTLSILGCDLPATLIKPKVDNPLGFWESQPIWSLNEDVLASGGSDWKDLSPFNPDWNGSPVSRPFLARAQEVLAAEYDGSRLLVLKDPRTCRLMPFWIEAVETFGADPVAIIPIRHPYEVAASLQKRNGFDPVDVQLLWLRHVLDAEHGSRHLRRIFVTFEDLLADWERVTDRIADLLQVEWPRKSLTARLEIAQFLSDEGRHHRVEDRHAMSMSPIRWIGETYDIMKRWAAGGKDGRDFATLDRIRGEFDAASPALRLLVLSQREAQARANRLTAEAAKNNASKQQG